MSKAVIKVVNCPGGKLEFPAKSDTIEVSNVGSMTIMEAKKYAFAWAHKNGRKVARVEVKIVFGRDGIEE